MNTPAWASALSRRAQAAARRGSARLQRAKRTALPPWLKLDPERRVTLLKLVTVLAIGASFLLSRSLWVSSRVFPLSPVADHLPAMPYPIGELWLLSLLVLLAAIGVARRPRRLILVFLSLVVLLSLWDQTRWQPWLYHYLFMLAAVGVLGWKNAEAHGNRAALNACRLIVISIYFWSGIQKLNVTFVRETWPDMASFLPSAWQSAAGALPSFLILLIPVSEILIAIGLLTRRFRDPTVIAATTLHLGILVLLVTSGENSVVWPWNVAMALFVWLLFRGDTDTTARGPLAAKKPFHALVMVLLGVAPALSLVGLWDSYLSSALYSGNTHQAVIYVSERVVARLPVSIHPHIWQHTRPLFLDINRWAYGELNVPVYPEPRVYRHVMRQICRYAGGDPDIRLRIKDRPHPLTGSRGSELYDCDHVN